MQEIWKPVPGFEDRYQVSSLGRVAFVKNGQRQRPRKAYTPPNGYPMILGVRVHRLVALAFIPNPDSLRTVNHIDGDKANNAASNLEWASHQRNQRHAEELGLIDHARGERINTARLTADDIPRIKASLAADVHPAEIAASYGVGRMTIIDIKLGKTWRHA